MAAWGTYLTANQVVAHNLRRAREARGWTQEEAGELIAPYIGSEWSKANWSYAERSAWVDDPDRVRNFNADDLLAFSLLFDLPVSWFLLPPDDLGDATTVQAEGAERGADREQLLSIALGAARSTEVRERVGKVEEVEEGSDALDREERRREVEEARRFAENLREALRAQTEQVNELMSRIEELEEEA